MKVGLTLLQKKDVDSNFKKFLNAYLRIFYHSFPYKEVHVNYDQKA
jgi:hypothetical protein